VQSELATSMLSLYRAGLRLRRATPELGDGSLRWIPSTDAVLAFARGERFTCIVNFGPDPVELPTGADVLIASNELEGGALPQDTTVWLSQANSIG
jgi:alpha-glucosidase